MNHKNHRDHELPEITTCGSTDALEMSTLCKRVFQTYPFPIDDPVYLQNMMNADVPYYAIRKSGRIAALAATDIDKDHQMQK